MIDDRMTNALRRFEKESEPNYGDEALCAAIAAVPYAGNPITSLIAGHAKRRVVERAQEVFEAVAERLRDVEKNKIDEAYFESDEFLTILTLAIEQLQTTHDKTKLGMIADALANSGRIEFSSESRKELFMRILRDLSPQHVSMLTSMRVNSYLLQRTDPSGQDLSVLQSLAAHGLVEESYKKEEPSGPRHGNVTSQAEATRIIKDMIMSPMHRIFRISNFGVDFLKFVASSNAAQNLATP